jgi:predicted phosphodiesterase
VSYSYDTEKTRLFSDDGQKLFIRVRDAAFIRDAGVTTLLYGHSHQGMDQVIDGVRPCVNAGSDYDVPTAVVVEV